nr:MAG TPA: hypothetical protein [Caudoviricetes sp.]
MIQCQYNFEYLICKIFTNILIKFCALCQYTKKVFCVIIL